MILAAIILKFIFLITLMVAIGAAGRIDAETLREKFDACISVTDSK